MRHAVSRKLAPFGTTIFTEITQLAIEHGAVNLAQGFPDFDGPPFVKDAAIAAIQEGRGQYARMTGTPDLHLSLAANQGISNAGDEIVLFEPYYDSYPAAIAMAGAVGKFVTLRAPDWGFDRK